MAPHPQEQNVSLLHVQEYPTLLEGASSVAKPVITRAVDTLGRYGYLKRKRDESDRRNVFIIRTVKGSVYLSELSDRVLSAEKASYEAHPEAVGLDH